MKLKDFWVLIKETVQDWSEDKAPRLAAALAYYTIFSLAPLLVLVIAITGFIVGNNADIRQQIITQVQGLMGAQAAESVGSLIEQTSQPRSGILATVLGIATLLLGATGLFGQLQDSLNTIWEVRPKAGGGIMGMIKDRFMSFTMVLGISFLLLVSLVISAGLSIVNNYFSDLLGSMAFLAQVLNFVISTGVITLIFAMIFKILPDVEIAWGDVWIGALVTALLFSIGKSLLGIYLGNNATASAYGAAGSLVILLLWVYYSAQILFLGAEFTQVYARRYGSKLVPSENARAISEEERLQEGLSARKTPAPRHQTEAEGIQGVQGSLIPVVGQPQIYANAPGEFRRERVRYEPPNPAAVVPVIALGMAATAYTLRRIVRKLIT